MQQFLQNVQHFFFVHMWLELFLRILLASVCGAAIGYERSRRFKDAGIRTLCIVSCVSALLMILSKYGFSDMVSAEGKYLFGAKEADPARIAAQVVSGIGFLGAGVIFKTGNSVRGLTTAACIWAAASVGMAIGCGMYGLGLFTVVAIVLLQYVLHKYTAGLDGYTNSSMTFIVKNDSDVLKELIQKLKDYQIIVVNSSIRRNNDETLTIQISTRMAGEHVIEEMIQMMSVYPEILSISM